MAGTLRDATTLEIRLVDRAKPDERGTVSLTGSSAAMRAMDARQLRAGTVTALVARGPAPASTIPPPPAAPVLVARRMRELPVPRRPGPNPVPDADPICRSAPEMWIAPSPGVTIRGVCSEGGAYNIVYRFYRVGAGRLSPLRFRVPWRSASPDDVDLVNPELAKDGLLLSGFSKGIGLGTCGESSDWLWSGREFRLFHFTEMRDCRGVTSESWPVLYQARMSF